ncbi:lipoprotein-anchoring transpeptidase ErfK/SrfK [Novosphingobium hassiacum]|uniref:Lipoprotein-anchoring transpeptidase ErfK/SrfK n=1 Tax=Novosphingobium hassiacum TaxID=173676 RepID=A0A7W6EVE9_9SPHN|nr:L,D-transpeptidase family protein [Novosphingobium hassiacum]MBB3859669.1 lipoprotein-anchoring transpeptidase ErfK/SrfK [Novosphingobium hassiacum]
MTKPNNLWAKRWVRLPLGFVATSLASLLAFHAGQDIAEVAFGNGVAEAAPMVSAAPKPAAATALAAKPVDGPFVVKSILPIAEPIKFGKFYWDETRAPASGALVVTVDLEARVISVFRDGHEIGAAAILKGYGDKPTPTGIFPITEKDADHVSNIYDAPMPHMLRLTNDGVSIHGSKVEMGYATNGCVGVPDEFARNLFKLAKLGDKVIITDGKKLTVGQPILTGDHAN